MISATEWCITCEEPRCNMIEQHTSRFQLMEYVRSQGWQLDVRLDGKRAKRNGKDYCPDHRKGPA